MKKVIIYCFSEGVHPTLDEQEIICKNFVQHLNQTKWEYPLKYKKERTFEEKKFVVDKVVCDNDPAKEKLTLLISELNSETYLLVTSVDVLTTNYEKALQISDLIEMKKARFMYVSDPLIEMDKKTFKILSSISQYEKKARRKAISEAMLSYSEEGILKTKPPFGWRSIGPDSPLVKDKAEQNILKQIVLLRKDHPDMKICEFCRLLDSNGIKIRKSKKCHHTTIRRIMNDNGIE